MKKVFTVQQLNILSVIYMEASDLYISVHLSSAVQIAQAF